MGRLDGKVAFITGATSGIGEAIANRYAKEGAKIVLTGRREELGNINAQKIIDAGGEATFIKMDVTKEEEVKEAVKKVVAKYGRIDILVNNAGVHLNKPFEDCTVEDWYKVLGTDGLGCCLMMWEILPLMQEQKSGCVINVSSKAASRPSEVHAFYGFVKAGMDHLTRCLTTDYSQYGIRINNLSPGLTLTEMTKDDPVFYEMAKTVPLGRYGNADEIAGVAVFLASDDASYVAGATINVDGGIVN